MSFRAEGEESRRLEWTRCLPSASLGAGFACAPRDGNVVATPDLIVRVRKAIIGAPSAPLFAATPAASRALLRSGVAAFPAPCLARSHGPFSPACGRRA